MVYRSKIISAFLLATVVSLPAPTFAADVDDVIYADDANFVKPAELGSSWYLRGEFGLNINGTQDVNSFGDPARTTLFDNNITDGYNFSVGAGKRINGFLRLEANIGRLAGANSASSKQLYAAGTAPFGYDEINDPDGIIVDTDVTLDGTPSIDPNACNGTGQYVNTVTGVDFLGPDFIENCVGRDSVEYDTTFAMMNAYVDLPKMAGFQPFIGGGLGVGRISWRQETGAIDCTPVSADLHLEGCAAYGLSDQPDPNTPYSQQGEINEGVGYRFGYQLAAGVAYDVSDNLTVDTTYKYTRYGDGSFDSGDGATLAAEGFSVHQVNVGLRYSFF